MFRLTGVKLLIVEADDLFRRNISQRMRLEKYWVFEARLESDARRIVQTKNVDVVLIGLKGLKQRGLLLLKAIKEVRPWTEVILMTPSDEHSLAASIEGMKLGAFDEILVPFDVETLIGRIREACRKKRDRERCMKPALQQDGP